MSNTFANDAREVAKTGDNVKAMVLAVGLASKRMSPPMKLDAKSVARGGRGDNSYRSEERGERAMPSRGSAQLQAQSATVAAFAKLQSHK